MELISGLHLLFHVSIDLLVKFQVSVKHSGAMVGLMFTGDFLAD